MKLNVFFLTLNCTKCDYFVSHTHIFLFELFQKLENYKLTQTFFATIFLREKIFLIAIMSSAKFYFAIR